MWYILSSYFILRAKILHDRNHLFKYTMKIFTPNVHSNNHCIFSLLCWCTWCSSSPLSLVSYYKGSFIPIFKSFSWFIFHITQCNINIFSLSGMSFVKQKQKIRLTLDNMLLIFLARQYCNIHTLYLILVLNVWIVNDILLDTSILL